MHASVVTTGTQLMNQRRGFGLIAKCWGQKLKLQKNLLALAMLRHDRLGKFSSLGIASAQWMLSGSEDVMRIISSDLSTLQREDDRRADVAICDRCTEIAPRWSDKDGDEFHFCHDCQENICLKCQDSWADHFCCICRCYYCDWHDETRFCESCLFTTYARHAPIKDRASKGRNVCTQTFDGSVDAFLGPDIG
jgi:hypothetical protein